MNVVAVFDPSLASTDSFVVPNSSAQGRVVVYNESNISLLFDIGGGQAYIPAWMAVALYGISGSHKITWAQQAQMVSNQPPLSQVVIETYDDDEQILGTFPCALVRQTNIGNASTVMSATTSIQNDGNVAGTSLIESTVGADLTSSVALDTAANLVLGNALHPGSFKADNAKIASDGAGNLTLQNLVSKGTSSLDNGKITSDGAGNLTMVKALFTKGGISHLSTFSGTGEVVAANHGLGATPDIIMLTYAGNFSPPPSNPAYWFSANATTVHVVGQGGYFWWGIAFKFS